MALIVRKGSNGFTLVELIAVITVVGIMAAVVGPKLIGSDVFETRGVQGSLLSALRYAQKTAIAQRKDVYVNMDASNRVICLGFTSDCSQAVIDPATQSAYSKTLSNVVTISVSNPVLGFDGLGRPVPNVDATYSVQNSVDLSQPAKVITVEADTGYVH